MTLPAHTLDTLEEARFQLALLGYAELIQRLSDVYFALQAEIEPREAA
ncbi:MAG TPA: hypothetical protein VFE72_06040 [Lysobacter sp.]|nr:hypothetical protein [Lysobacter sp.]